MHNTTKIKPVDAAEKENHLCVSLHLWNNATRSRQYPKISQNDYVRIKINQRKHQKASTQHSQRKRKVAAIKDGQHYIPSYHKHRLWLRHGLLLL